MKMALQILTWNQWLRFPQNKKLAEENVHKAKAEYLREQYMAEQYFNYVNIAQPTGNKKKITGLTNQVTTLTWEGVGADPYYANGVAGGGLHNYYFELESVTDGEPFLHNRQRYAYVFVSSSVSGNSSVYADLLQRKDGSGATYFDEVHTSSYTTADNPNITASAATAMIDTINATAATYFTATTSSRGETLIVTNVYKGLVSSSAESSRLTSTASIAVTTTGFDTFTDSTGDTGVNDPAQTIDDRGISDKYKRFSNQ